MGRTSIRSDFDEVTQITTLFVVGRIESEADCEQWLREHEELAGRTSAYQYWIAVLDMFSVAPEVFPIWARYTEEFANHFNGVAIVVGYDASVASVAHLSPALREFFADDIPGATAAIERIRASDNPQPRRKSASASTLKSPRWRERTRIG
jgi:hypothetical protein